MNNIPLQKYNRKIIKRALAGFVAGVFLFSDILAWAGPAESSKLAPSLGIANEDFKNSLRVAAICKQIETDGNIGSRSYIADVLKRLDSDKRYNTAISPYEIIIEIPGEGLAVRYFDPSKASVITPYSDISSLSTKVIGPNLSRQIIHRAEEELNKVLRKIEKLTAEYYLVPASKTEKMQEVESEINQLTREAIKITEEKGGLKRDVVMEALTSTLVLDNQVKDYLIGETVLISGAAGVGGSCLCDYILSHQELKPKKIILTDINDEKLQYFKDEFSKKAKNRGITLISVSADLSNREKIESMFEKYRPGIVFHVAAQRVPALAEKYVLETTAANLFGTKNMAEMAHKYKAKRFIYCSTGKSRHFYDERIYAVTKKLAEEVVNITSSRSKTRFGIVRFHQVMSKDNDLLKHVRKCIEDNVPVTIYYQEDYKMPVQSVEESVVLTLNAGVYAEKAEIYGINRKFFDPEMTAVNIALYEIKKSGKNLPLYLTPPPPGHLEEYFKGATDQNDKEHRLSYFNYLESQTAQVTGNLNQAKHPRFDAGSFEIELAKFFNAWDKEIFVRRDEQAARSALIECMKSFTRNIYSHCPIGQLAQVIVWGTNPSLVKKGKIDLRYENNKKVISTLIRVFYDRSSEFMYLSIDMKNDIKNCLNLLLQRGKEYGYSDDVISKILACNKELASADETVSLKPDAEDTIEMLPEAEPVHDLRGRAGSQSVPEPAAGRASETVSTSSANGTSQVGLHQLVKASSALALNKNKDITYLAIAGISEDHIRVAFTAGIKFHTPVLFIIYRPQVDLKEFRHTDADVYTGWDQFEFMDIIRKIADEMNFPYSYTVIRDHGGLTYDSILLDEKNRNKDTLKRLDKQIREAMERAKVSLSADFEAGFDSFHIDNSILYDASVKDISERLEPVLKSTVELMVYLDGLHNHSVDYGLEVQVDPIGSGENVTLEEFRYFLDTLHKRLTAMGIKKRPDFYAANTGTSHGAKVEEPDINLMLNLDVIAKMYGARFSQHGTSGVPLETLGKFPGAVGKANVDTALAMARITAIRDHAKEVFKQISEFVLNSDLGKKKLASISSTDAKQKEEAVLEVSRYYMQHPFVKGLIDNLPLDIRTKIIERMMGVFEMYLPRFGFGDEKTITDLNSTDTTDFMTRFHYGDTFPDKTETVSQPAAGRAVVEEKSESPIREYISNNESLFNGMLGEDKQNVLLRIPIEAIEAIGAYNIKAFLEKFQKASNAYVEMYYMSGTGEVAEGVYRKYGLEKKSFKDKDGKDVKRTKENTITLLPVLKGEEISQAMIASRLGSLDMKPEDTILSPIGLQHDGAGLIRSAILGLGMLDIARHIKEKGVDQAFKDEIQVRMLERLKYACNPDDLKSVNLTPDDVIALVTGNINSIIPALNKLIRLLPITPIDAEELRQIYEHVRKVLVAA